MKSKEEYYSELLARQQEERQNLMSMGSLFHLCQEIEDYVKKFEVGYVRIDYYSGSNGIEVNLYTDEGFHPIKEALILIDEVIYKYDWIKETRTPSSPIVGKKYIYWTFKDEDCNLDFYLNLKESGGCKQVGTGKFEEIMEWKCI